MKAGVFRVFFAVFALGGCGSPPEESTDAMNAAGAMNVTVAELVTAYDANEVRAQQRYSGNLLRVIGKIDAIALNSDNKPFVTFASEAVFPPVQANFTPDGGEATGNLIKGQDAILLCREISEMLGTPMLDKCEVESVSTS